MPAGPIGPQGVAGSDGSNGAAGSIGPQGVAGAVGAIGPQGVAGWWSAGGPQGVAGAAGAAGAIGPQGVAGAAGAAGPQGVAGSSLDADSYQAAFTLSNELEWNLVIGQSKPQLALNELYTPTWETLPNSITGGGLITWDQPTSVSEMEFKNTIHAYFSKY